MALMPGSSTRVPTELIDKERNIDMAVEYVKSGDKIQASQYNALVDALAGPKNATTDQPFT